MAKITFMGAGSTVFAKNILGDCMLTPALHDAHIALYDIDATRLRESQQMLETLNRNVNQGRARITAHRGVAKRRAALKGADYVVNAIQVGGYKPGTVIDFEIPKRFGLRQTIADTCGIGGIFRALRTIPVMLDFARDMQEVCPRALMLNYTNPMPTLSTAMTRAGGIAYVGLCHSVQGCAAGLIHHVGLERRYPMKHVQWKIAGINHMSWLLEVTYKGRDIYPAIKRAAAAQLARIHRAGGGVKLRKQLLARHKGDWRQAWNREPLFRAIVDMVRLEIMLRFGFYNTESSEHSAEYHPYWIKSRYPKLVDEYAIPLDEYPRRCVNQIKWWKVRAKEIVRNPKLEHARTHEYGSRIMEAVETDIPCRIGGNVLNTGLVTNLPETMAVEVPCLVDRNGVQGCHVGALPEVCAALNRTNVNVHLLTVEAALTRKKEAVYHAALLDPRTRSELTIDQTVKMCDALLKAHGKMMPRYR